MAAPLDGPSSTSIIETPQYQRNLRKRALDGTLPPALEWLTRCADTLEDGVLGIKQGREYDFLRDDPRFQALYRRGLP